LFPNYRWALLAPEHLYVTKSLLECNYLQGLEGECDSSHLSFLHREFDPRDEREQQRLFQQDTAPDYEFEQPDFGVRLIALRQADADQLYLRISSLGWPTHRRIHGR